MPPSLCAFVSQEDQHSIIEVKELEQEEYLAYRKAAKALIGWANDNHAYEAIWRTFRELSETVEQFKQQHESGKWVWDCPVSTDCLPLSHSTSSHSSFFVL